MSKQLLSEIFPGDFFQYVSKYCVRIQYVLDNYDIVVFMARKAICFYEALVLNGEISPSKCKVISSRAVEYNVVKDFAGKKIAIIDDVVVKGESINQVVSLLKNELQIKPDIYVIACRSTFPSTLSNDVEFNLTDTYIELDQKDIYAFAGMITEYIGASMCPFNIDQPMYTFKYDRDSLNSILYQNHAVDISSGLQIKHKIHSNVIYFSATKCDLLDDPFFTILSKCIIKIRILNNDKRCIATPFILFPELTIDELNFVSSRFFNNSIINFLRVSSEQISIENILKFTCYVLSDLLVRSFFEREKVLATKLYEYDDFQFTDSIDSFFEDKVTLLCNQEYGMLLENFTTTQFDFSQFAFPEILSRCYQAIAEPQTFRKKYYNNKGVSLENETIITLDMLENTICDFSSEAHRLASCVIDVLIDKGMIVPSIVHLDNGILRAYKLGEYSKLSRNQIESFAAMLFDYQGLIAADINKTEFEKLCVLFFRMAQNRGVFLQQENYEDGCFSVAYSLYGPRVSSSEVSYRVGFDSPLITDFFNNDKGRRLIDVQNGRYVIRSISAVQNYKDFCFAFAYQYYLVRSVFDSASAYIPMADSNKEKNIRHHTNWNMYVHTYIQYLTLKAIGENKKNQYLSLSAEIYQVTLLPKKVFDFRNETLKTIERILSGVNSGLWKYWCFTNEALQITNRQILQKNKSAGAIILLEREFASDTNTHWNEKIKTAGEFLYRFAVFFNEVLVALNATDKFQIKEGISESEDEPYYFSNGTIFSTGSYYNKSPSLVDFRRDINRLVRENVHSDSFLVWADIEIQRYLIEARQLLAICDLVISNNNPISITYEKALIIYSETCLFPDFSSFSLTELWLDGIINRKHVKIFGVKEEQKVIPILSKIFASNETVLMSSRVFLLDFMDPLYYSCRIENGARGVELSKKINTIISCLEKTNSHNSGEIYFISPETYKEPVRVDTLVLTPLKNEEICHDHLANQILQSILGSNYLSPPAINIFQIRDFNHYQGGHDQVKVDVAGNNYGQIIEKNYGASVINNEGFLSNIDKYISELESIKAAITNEEKRGLVDTAINSLHEKNESKFLQIMKKIGLFIRDIASNLSANLILDFLKLNGIIS